jgi:hypothetical protein
VVLGRPVSLEAVCGVLLERIPANAGHDGLGRAGNRR